MVESDIRKHNATNHHETHDGTIMTDVQPDDREHHIPEISQEVEEHHQEEHEQAERNIAMKDRISQPLIGLVFTLIAIAALGAGNTVQAANIDNGIAGYSISTNIPADTLGARSIGTIQAETIDINAINVNILKDNIREVGITDIVSTDILKDNLINKITNKEGIAY